MQQNPYRSPALAREVPGPSRTTRRPTVGVVTRAIFGIWAGVLFGGTFGAVGSAALGLAHAATVHWFAAAPVLFSFDEFVLAEIVTAIAGAICGLFAGALIGPLVALMTWFAPRPHRVWPALALAIGLSTAAGGGWGAVAGAALHPSYDISSGNLLVVGTAIGAIAGMLGGLQLGRGIVAFASAGGTDAGGIDARP